MSRFPDASIPLLYIHLKSFPPVPCDEFDDVHIVCFFLTPAQFPGILGPELPNLFQDGGIIQT